MNRFGGMLFFTDGDENSETQILASQYGKIEEFEKKMNHQQIKVLESPQWHEIIGKRWGPYVNEKLREILPSFFECHDDVDDEEDEIEKKRKINIIIRRISKISAPLTDDLLRTLILQYTEIPHFEYVGNLEIEYCLARVIYFNKLTLEKYN